MKPVNNEIVAILFSSLVLFKQMQLFNLDQFTLGSREYVLEEWQQQKPFSRAKTETLNFLCYTNSPKNFSQKLTPTLLETKESPNHEKNDPERTSCLKFRDKYL